MRTTITERFSLTHLFDIRKSESLEGKVLKLILLYKIYF